jgi:cysteine desulfurase
MNKIYYFDNNATTRVAPEVAEVVASSLQEYWGNPSSAYAFGNRALKQIDLAREKTAALLSAEPKDIIFTSCGTESNNTAIHSALVMNPGKRHVVTTAVEHAANINYCQFLGRQGCQSTFLPVDSDGMLDLKALEAAIRPDTAMVSIMYANNETGILFPIEAISEICRAKGVLFHTDAVQTPGKLHIDIDSLGVDFLSLSGHKLHAPKGIGLLYIRKRTKFQPYLMGGHQERGRRGGTENVAGIMAFGRAAELAMDSVLDENTRIRAMRDRLEMGILQSIAGVERNGAKEPRLPNTTSLAFKGVESEAILMLLDQAGICASSGSACTTGSLEPSHVLSAMGISAERARSSIRFSLGIYNTDEEVDYLLSCLPGIIQKLRAFGVS